MNKLITFITIAGGLASIFSLLIYLIDLHNVYYLIISSVLIGLICTLQFPKRYTIKRFLFQLFPTYFFKQLINDYQIIDEQNNRIIKKFIRLILKKKSVYLDSILEKIDNSEDVFYRDKLCSVLANACSVSEKGESVFNEIIKTMNSQSNSVNVLSNRFKVLSKIKSKSPSEVIKIFMEYILSIRIAPELRANALENLTDFFARNHLFSTFFPGELLSLDSSTAYQVLEKLAYFFGITKNECYLPRLYELLDDNHLGVQIEAVKAIGEIEEHTGNQEVLKKLLDFCKKPESHDNELIEEVARTMERIDHEIAVNYIWLSNNFFCEFYKNANNSFSGYFVDAWSRLYKEG